MSSLTPEVFDTAILVVIIFGIAFAVVRLYADFTRRLPPDELADAPYSEDDTRPNPVVEP